MLKNISWMSYWSFVFGTSVIYYAVICIKFYPAEIRQFIYGSSASLLKKTSSGNQHVSSDAGRGNQTFEVLSHSELMSLISGFMKEIKNVLEQSANDNLTKQEIIYSVQHHLKRYALLEKSSFRSFINNYVLVECSNYCSICLDDDELNMLWQK